MDGTARIVLIGLVLAAPLIIVGALWLSQRSLIYFPARSGPAVPEGWDEVSLDTTDGIRLTAWIHDPEPQHPIIIVFPGNAGNRAGRLPMGQALVERGFGVLLVDYRGYGGNAGSPTEHGLTLDSRAAIGFTTERLPGTPRWYFGESLGAAVAVELAGEYPPQALILRSPFTSLVDVARHHYPFVPVATMLWDEYPSLERMASIDVPLLVIAGAADSTVPLEQSRTIYEAAAGPKQLLVIPGADHNDAVLQIGPEMMDAIEGMRGW